MNKDLAHFFAPILLLGAALLCYANTLGAPFVFDDRPAIVENPSIRNLHDWRAVLSPPTTAGSAAGRPLINLSFALNHAAGGLDPRGYHVVNVALHALAALALFTLLRRTLAAPVVPESLRRNPTPPAFAVALLWTVHPLLTESVACTVQRTEILGGLFLLITLHAYARASESGTSFFWKTTAAAACFAGVASKEIVAMAPLLALAWDFLFVTSSLRATLRARGPLLLALACSWLLLGWLVIAGGQRGGVVGFGHGVTAWEYLLTSCGAIVHYLRLCFWPHPLVLDYGTDVVRSLSPVLPQALFLVTLFALTLRGLFRREPAAFAGVWFFLILAPSSSVLPLVSQTAAEHRMYLPLAAVVALIILPLVPRLGRALWPAVAVVAIGLSLLTVQRNATYRTAVAILSDTVARRPDNSRAHSLLSQALAREGRLDEALAASREAARLAPASPEMLYNLGSSLLEMNRPAEAVTAFNEALRLRPDYPEAHCNLGAAHLALRHGREAFAHLQTALQLRPDYADAHYNLGNLFAQTGRLPPAIAAYEAAIALAPDRAATHFNLGRTLLLAGRAADAITHFEAVLRLTPGDPDAAAQLARARAAAAR